jgi:hypothetical protein
MKSPVFFFLGVAESTIITDISLLKSQLETALASYNGQVKFDIQEQLLIVRQSQPHFSFYISFVNNDPKTLAEWKELAKNFELPWDIKPVNRERLANIFGRLETNGWLKYSPFQKFGYIILEEMEKFQQVKIFTIPSMGKPSLWNRILGR